MPTLPIQGLRRRLEGEEGEGGEAATEGEGDEDSTVQAAGPPDEDTAALKKKQFEALFPTAFMTKEQIQNGGFIVYFLGK